jgi:hypothetical protein
MTAPRRGSLLTKIRTAARITTQPYDAQHAVESV